MAGACTVKTLNDTVDDELGALPADMRARFMRIAELIEVAGAPVPAREIDLALRRAQELR